MIICDPKKPKNQDFRACRPRSFLQNRENGSAIVWILVMVALFAALSYVVSSGFRAGESNLSKEKTDLIVSEMLDYAQAIKQAVQTLQINGCNETEISFDNNASSYYVNPNSPTDNSCHVFHPNGGGITYIENPTEIETEGIEFVTSTDRAVPGIGNTNNIDLFLRISFRGVSYEPCHLINERNNILPENLVPPGAFDPMCPGNIGYANTRFTGSFSDPATSFASNSQTHGKQTFCVGTGTDRAHFFHVLMAR